MLIRPLLPALLGAALACGCANPPAPAVQRPTTAASAATSAKGPSARLLVRTLQPGGGTASISTFEQPVACARRQVLERTSIADPPRSEFALRAGRLQTLSFLYVRGDRRGCELIVSFEPKANRTYLMRNRVLGDHCELELIDATNPDRPQLEPSTLRRERTGAPGGDDICRPISSTAAPRGRGDALPEAFREVFSR